MKTAWIGVLLASLTSLCVVAVDAMPAQAATFGSVRGTTLTITQSGNNGDLVIDKNGLGSAWRASDGSGTVTFVAAANLVVNLLPNTTNALTLDVDSAHAGSVTLNLGDGNRAVNFTGTNNTFGTDVTITGGAGAQVVELAVNANFGVGGTLTIDLGTGIDMVDEDNRNVTIGTDMNLSGAKFENGGTMTVGGNVFVDQRGDDDTGDFDNDASMTINGNMRYEGNDLLDNVQINGNFHLVGNLVTNTRLGQSTVRSNDAGASILGTITSTATEDTLLDDFLTHATNTYGTSFAVDYGDGTNTAQFLGSAPNAGNGSYIGGTGVDTVTMGIVAPNLDFVVRLGAGSDSFTLQSSTVLASLYVDFGCGGTDLFTTTFAIVPTWVKLVNQGPCVVPSADLTAVKTNDTAGQVLPGASFNWSVGVANTGAGDAVFSDADVLLVDTLPAGATISAVSVTNPVNVARPERISCTVVTTTLTCRATGAAGVIVGGTSGLGAGRFDVTMHVTPIGPGTLVNTCIVDPNSKVAESAENNNTCADTVTALPPPFVTLTPARLYETRTAATATTADGLQQHTGRRVAGQVTTVNIAGRLTIPANASAAFVNVAAIAPDGPGFLTLYPCDQPQPTASTLNYTAGTTIANGALVKLDPTGSICIFTHAGAHLIVDVTGYIPAGSTVTTLTPARLYETRTAATATTADGLQQHTGRRVAGQVTTVNIAGRLTIPANASAAFVNVAAIAPDGPGFLTLYPCDQPQPTASTLNYTAGTTIANGALVKLDPTGSICIFTHAGAHLIVDVTGYIPAGSTVTTLTPARLYETRTAATATTADGLQQHTGRRTAGQVTTVNIAGRLTIPANASAAFVNVAAIAPDGPGFLTLYPCDQPQPTASTLNYTAGTTIANGALVKLDPTGSICVFTHAGAHLIVDVTAYIPA